MEQEDGPTDVFASLLVSLQGVRILEKPRVSREVIIFVLKEHTEMMKEFKMELNAFNSIAQNLLRQTDENKKAISVMSVEMENNRNSILRLDKKTIELQEDLNAVQEKIAEFAVIKQVLKEHKVELNDIDMRLRSLTGEMRQHAEATNHAMTALEIKTNDSSFQVKELKHRVDHFGDHLTLSSNQIVVESSVGFSKRPMGLTDVLKQCHENFDKIDNSIVKQGDSIAANALAVEGKADATILMQVETLEGYVTAIKDHIKKEEKQGVNSLRRICDELTVAVEAIQSEMTGKMDRNSVDVIIHRKYEDIVEYLQEALQASAEDEDNFKNISNQLQDTVNKLMGSKADRLEIQPMQEALVKFESILLKLGVQTKEKSRSSKDSAGGVSRQELQAALDMKMDKAEFDAQMIALTKMRRDKKMYPAMGIIGGVEDAALSGDPSKDTRDALMWKGLADAMKDESEAALTRGVVGRGSSNDSNGGGGGRAGGGGAHSRRATRHKSMRPIVGLPSSQLHQSASLPGIPADMALGFPSNLPGKFRQASEAGKSGGIVTNISSLLSSSSTYDGNGSSTKVSLTEKVSSGSLPPSGFLPPAHGAKSSASPIPQFGIPKPDGTWPSGKIWEHGRDPANSKIYEHNTEGAGGGPIRKPKPKRHHTSASYDESDEFDTSADESDGQQQPMLREDSTAQDALNYYADSDYANSDHHRLAVAAGAPGGSPATDIGGQNNPWSGVDNRAPVLGGGFNLGATGQSKSPMRKKNSSLDEENDMVVKGADGRLYYTDDDSTRKTDRQRHLYKQQQFHGLSCCKPFHCQLLSAFVYLTIYGLELHIYRHSATNTLNPSHWLLIRTQPITIHTIIPNQTSPNPTTAHTHHIPNTPHL
eukprot:gene6488-13093_t